MSLLDDDSKLPSFVLRKHTKPVTALEFVRVPVSMSRRAITSGDDGGTKTTLKPFVLSGDEDGRVILWDLATRRPVIDKKCHTLNVLTIKQLGITDSTIDHRYFGLIITHGRDNCIKFWNLFDDRGVFSFEEVYDLPENALNFSNIDIFNDGLVTPNTMNSNAFDIYDISFLTEQVVDDKRLTRDWEAIDVYQTAMNTNKHTFEEFKLKRDDDDSTNRTDKFGIIMKLLWAKPDLLIIGYESGHVAHLKINPKAKSFDIIRITNHHFPDPVLSLSYDSTNDVVISSSVASQIVIHDLQTQASTPIRLESFGKISSVATINDKYILSSWNGLIKFFTLNKTNMTLEYHHSFKKPKGMIAGDLNIIGNIQGNQDIKKKNIIKPNTMAIVDQSEVAPGIQKLLGRRDVAVIASSFLSVAYDDGTIAVYTQL